MLIVIKEPNGRHFKLPLPYQFCINLAVREAWFRMAITHRSGLSQSQKDQYQAYLELIDFGELRMALKALGGNKGLDLIEVSAKDGTYIRIRT